MQEKRYSHDQIETLKQNVKEGMKLAFDKIHEIKEPFELFRQMKFGKLGFTPFGSSSENILEQINQSFTILMSCYAAIKYFPKAHCFSFAFAQSSGRDMIVYDEKDKRIAEVEIFTTVDAKNNGKLRKDVNRMRDANIVDGCQRMVCYSAQDEHKLKRMPGDEKVDVKFTPLNKFYKWIEEE